ANARQKFVEETLAALRGIPGFESFTMSADIPLLLGGGSNTLYARPDGEVPPIDKRQAAALHNIAPDYLKTWGIPLLAGREFDDHDNANGRGVMLISQAGAKKIFGYENPIGKSLLVSSTNISAEIVGVVGDVRSRKVAEPDEVEIYRPWAQQNFPFLSIAVRSSLKPNAITKLVQSSLATVNPGLAIALPQAMDEIIAQALGQTRLMMWL